jgi:hypothetical protein
MGTTKRRYPKDEIRKRGEEIFETKVRPHLIGRDSMDIVLIDIETQDYEIDADHWAALCRLRERNPDAQIWARRVGSPHIHHFGGRVWREAK